MGNNIKSIPLSNVNLLPGILKDRTDVNRKYLMSLKSENLLQNHYLEAGFWQPSCKPDDCHWGWESPTSWVRGQFLGHWLSAAAKLYNSNRDTEMKAKADNIVSELARCQKENGGEWVGSIPEKYLYRLIEGKVVWAPVYVLHKTMMGLLDMYEFGGNEQALDIANNFAKWFIRWTNSISREEMDKALELETGGMLEIWAILYGITNNPEHLELIRRFDRRFLFDRLIAGEDVLTNMHANTTIPEILGAAHAWEVTGDLRWKKAVEAYWLCAVTDRSYFCTGGQTNGEVWCPPNEFSASLGPLNQEHCTVYNMMRLAQWLFIRTGDVKYADYIERNLYNGILAQQNPETGTPSYFLPLGAGSVKAWGTPTETFWCCHGSVVQANTIHQSFLYYSDDEGIIVSQYFPSKLDYNFKGVPVKITATIDTQAGNYSKVIEFNPGKVRRPKSLAADILVQCSEPLEFTLKLRIPWWLRGNPVIKINGELLESTSSPSTYYSVKRIWHDDKINIEFPKELVCEPIPDRTDMVAFMDGPVVLAGLCETERTLYGDIDNPSTILRPYDERHWSQWSSDYYTQNQSENFKFMPLYQVKDQKYTVYFPIKER